MDDRSLLNRALRSDRKAFEALLRRHSGAILNYLRRFMPDRDDAEDIAQEVFILAFRNLHKFDPERGEFRSWLYRIATNSSLNELKRRERASLRESVAAEMQSETASGAWIPGREIESVEIVEHALQTLPDTERQVILLSYYHDLPYREISKVLDIPLGTVKSRMHSAVKRLRQFLVPREEGELP